MKHRLVVVIYLTTFLLYGGQLHAFEVNVHEQISINAIDSVKSGLNGYLSGIGLSKGIDESIRDKRIREWIQEGSRQEDEPLLDFRYLNHFYNPLDGRGLHDGLFTGKSSYEWASFDQSNLWSWAMLRQYYHTGLVHQDLNQREIFLSKAFRSLGHNMHLVQDLASPAHVRNDGHPTGDGFEGYTKREDIVDTLNYTPYSFANALTSVSSLAPKQFWDSDIYTLQNPNSSSNNIQGLAEYTNANFASDDTIFTENNLNDWNPLNDGHYFPRPARTDVVLYDEFLTHNETIGYDVYRRYFFKTNGGGEEIKHFAYAGRLYKYYISQATDWEKTLGLDDQCYKDYAQKLIPRAVGYSSGLLNYFFRGKVNMEKDPQNAGKYIIKNESTEKMEGTFALYYDDVAENRKAVPGASWTFSGDKALGAGGKSDPVTFTEPTSPAPKEKGKYILVFQGKLGMEEGTVVGRVVELKKDRWEDWNTGDYIQSRSKTYYWFNGTFKVTDTQFNLKTDKRTWEGWWNTWASPDPAIRINDGFLKMDADTGNYTPDSQHEPMLQGLLYKSIIESPFSITGCKIKINASTAKFGYPQSDNSLKAFLLITNGSNYYVLIYSLVDGYIERSLEDDFRGGLAIENSYSDENIKSYISDINNWYITLIALFYQVEGANNHLSLSMDYIDFDCNHGEY